MPSLKRSRARPFRYDLYDYTCFHQGSTVCSVPVELLRDEENENNFEERTNEEGKEPEVESESQTPRTLEPMVNDPTS